MSLDSDALQSLKTSSLISVVDINDNNHGVEYSHQHIINQPSCAEESTPISSLIMASDDSPMTPQSGMNDAMSGLRSASPIPPLAVNALNNNSDHPLVLSEFPSSALLPMDTQVSLSNNSMVHLSFDKTQVSSPISIPKRRRSTMKVGGRPSLPLHLKKWFSREKAGGLRLTDADALDKQKGILLDLLKQASKALFDGQGMTAISLPVRVFTADTLLEKYASSWGYAPELLSRAATLNTETINEMIPMNGNNSEEATTHLSIPVERMKLCMAFALSSLHLLCYPLKPFNPILGETFSARFNDGTALYFESTSHHPLIFHFHVEGPNHSYTYHGHVESTASVGTGNTASVSFKGRNVVEFKSDGQRISWNFPVAELSGLLWGNRVYNWKGVIDFKDEMNELNGVMDLSEMMKAPVHKGFYEANDWCHCTIYDDSTTRRRSMAMAAAALKKEERSEELNGVEELPSLSNMASMATAKNTTVGQPSEGSTKCESPLDPLEEEALLEVGNEDKGESGQHHDGDPSGSTEVETKRIDCDGDKVDGDSVDAEEKNCEKLEEVKRSGSSSSEIRPSSKSSLTTTSSVSLTRAKIGKTLKRVWGGFGAQRKPSAQADEGPGVEQLQSGQSVGMEKKQRAVQSSSSFTSVFRKKNVIETTTAAGHSDDMDNHASDHYPRIVVAQGEGSWLEALWFNDICYWDVHTTPFASLEITGLSDALPSDSRYRRDLNYFRAEKKQESQHWKELLETRQRQDRTIRAKARAAIGCPDPYCS